MDNELTIKEVNGILYEDDEDIAVTADNPSMCYNPTNLAQCGSVHSIWHGCGANRYHCYIDCPDIGAFLSTAE